MKHVEYGIVLLVPLLLASCRQQKSTNVIARVGDAELTLTEALSQIDTTQSELNNSLKQYISYWVRNELLYQEAKRIGAENTDAFSQQLRKVQQTLAIQVYLDQSIYADTAVMREHGMREYFQQHASEFTIREEMLKLHKIMFNSRERASTFAAKVAQGVSWESAVQFIIDDSSIARSVVSAAAGSYYTQQTLFPPELWKVAKALNLNEISFPVRTSQGYAVLQLLSIAREGQQAEYELVRDEVRQRLLIEKRQKHYEQLLDTLRTRYKVEIFLDSLKPTVTSQDQSHE